MKRYILNKGKMVALLAIAAIIALSTLGAAFAASPGEDGKAKQGLFGTVKAKSDNSFTLQTSKGDTIELAVTADTKFRMPGEAKASFDDLKLGTRVAVLAETRASAATALKVMPVPGEPQREHRTLAVIEVSGKTVIAEDAKGNRVEVELDQELLGELKGQLMIFIGARSQQSNHFKAHAEVKIGNVVKRLEAHAEKLQAEAKSEANAEVKAKKGRDLVQLRARLETNMQRHLDLFAETIAKAPEQAKPSLEAALEMTLKGYRTALEALGESQAKAKARLELRQAHGFVEEINTETSQMTLRSRVDTTLTLKVTGDTQIRIGEERRGLADISTGDQVVVRYDRETLVATEIKVKVEAEAEGTIQNIDSARGQLILTLTNGATLTLKLTPDTEIEINDKKATAAALQSNALIEVKYNIKTMEIQEIEAETRGEVEGTIKAVDSTSGTVTILTDAGKELTLKITDSTLVKIKGLLFGVLGVSAGMEVEVKYDLTSGGVLELKAESEGRPEAEAKEEAKVTGTITSINLASGDITVKLAGGEMITLHADDETEIEVGEESEALGDIQVGHLVKIEYDTNTMIASEIKVLSGARLKAEIEVHGTIEAVDTTGDKVVIRLRDGFTKELVLSGDTVIRINGLLSSEADLKVGMEVEARYRADANTALRINTTVKGPVEFRGKVKSLDIVTGQVVIETTDGRAIKVSVTPNTEVIFDGRPGLLLNLEPGADVKVDLKVDSSGNVALKIHVGANEQEDSRGQPKGSSNSGSSHSTQGSGSSEAGAQPSSNTGASVSSKPSGASVEIEIHSNVWVTAP